MALRKALPTEAFYEKGLTAFASAIPPKQEYLARIKSTNYLPNVFMAAEARQRGMDVAVTFDEDGHLGEAAIANVGIVDAEGRLCCPEGRRILPGTSMLAARKIAPQRLPVVERPIRREEIFTAREMLLFTSASLCVGISHFEGRPIRRAPTPAVPAPWPAGCVTPCWNTCWLPARRSRVIFEREGAPSLKLPSPLRTLSGKAPPC